MLRELYESFRRTGGWPLAFLSLLLSLVLFVVKADATIHLRVIVPFACAGIVCFIVSADLAIRMWRRAANQLPQVLAIVTQPVDGASSRHILLLEPSPLFGHGSMVSIYNLREDGFEVLVGLGHVATVQQDGRIQVLLVRELASPEEIARILDATNSGFRRRLLVKPSMPVGYWEVDRA